MEHHFEADRLVGDERDRFVIGKLRALEAAARGW
jgi:hypothetical protein